MNRQLLASVCEQIYRRFPDIAGVQPKVENRPGDQFLLIFKGSGRTADGKAISSTVRVVINQDGKILKATTSR
jgi:hypothetical protein